MFKWAGNEEAQGSAASTTNPRVLSRVPSSLSYILLLFIIRGLFFEHFVQHVPPFFADLETIEEEEAEGGKEGVLS